MLGLAPTLCEWLDRGHEVAVATLVSVDGSAPRSVGAAMAMSQTGRVAGSISGGCIEGTLVEACAEVLAGGPPQLLEFGAGDDFFEPGLTCGGTISVLVSSLAALDDSAIHQLRRAAAGQAASLSLDAEGGACTNEPLVTLESAPGHELLLIGAVEFAVALCRLGTMVGFRVTVCDPRPMFAKKERFPDAHAVVCDWPDRWLKDRVWARTDAVCVLSHDLKVDQPALVRALASPAGFVGAMGSRRTHERRVEALRQDGATDHEIARLRSPLGLDIGASTPDHTAVSILAEIIGVHNRRFGEPLCFRDGPIHH